MYLLKTLMNNRKQCTSLFIENYVSCRNFHTSTPHKMPEIIVIFNPRRLHLHIHTTIIAMLVDVYYDYQRYCDYHQREHIILVTQQWQ